MQIDNLLPPAARGFFEKPPLDPEKLLLKEKTGKKNKYTFNPYKGFSHLPIRSKAI